MKAKVLGLQTLDYISRKTGQPVKGVTMHCSYYDQQVRGQAVSSIFVSDNLQLDCVYNLEVGDEVDIEYSNRGYVCNVTPLS